jgi:hypothetical protein
VADVVDGSVLDVVDAEPVGADDVSVGDSVGVSVAAAVELVTDGSDASAAASTGVAVADGSVPATVPTSRSEESPVARRALRLDRRKKNDPVGRSGRSLGSGTLSVSN